MASYLDKTQLNTAITKSTKLDLSHVHITTANFMQLSPIYNKEMVPGEKIDVNLDTFSRMNPLPVPTFGRAMIKNRAYFVPFRTIFRGWNDFITDSPHTASANNNYFNIPSSVPTVTNNILIQALLDVDYGINLPGHHGPAVRSVDPSLNVVDFTYIDDTLSTPRSQHYQFTNVGRQLMKVLESLGYKINWRATDATKFSALPLLAFGKVYVDWYFPSAYTDVAEYNYILQLCNIDTGQAAGYSLNKVDVGRILQMVYTCYDSDYFVSAFDNPVNSNSGNFSTILLSDITSNQQQKTFISNYSTNGSTVGSNLAPTITGGGNGVAPVSYNVSNLSQYALDSLRSLTDYMKRHQLAGSRAMDRYLARFGKALPAEKLNRSVYLGCQNVPIQFGDIMSTAETDGAVLGEYAGKGLGYGESGRFTFSTDEYGLFLMVSTITPSTGYYQGIDRTVKHISKLDFWTPEFDNLGTQAITADELYVTRAGDSSLGLSAIHDSIFGFAPRYAEYKVARDQVTGNFRIPSLNTDDVSTNNGSASWHLMRSFDDGDWQDASGKLSVDNIKHSVNFVYSRGDIGQYNRIFNNDSSVAPDNFTLIHDFNIASYSPMLPLYDTYEFDEKGREVTLDVNGVKHN